MFCCRTTLSSVMQTILCCSSQTQVCPTLTTLTTIYDLKTAFSSTNWSVSFQPSAQWPEQDVWIMRYVCTDPVHVTCSWAAVRDTVCFSTCQCGTLHMFQQTEPGSLIPNVFSKTNQVVFVPKHTQPPEPPEPVVARLVSVKPRWVQTERFFMFVQVAVLCWRSVRFRHKHRWVRVRTHLGLDSNTNTSGNVSRNIQCCDSNCGRLFGSRVGLFCDTTWKQADPSRL